MPRTTVVIKSYNRPALVIEALQSCQNQSQACNILIVDDGSSPAAAEAVINLASLHSNVEVLALSHNSGPAHVNNVAISRVSTPFLAFLDSDDLLETHFVERLEAALDENTWADFAYCRFVDGPAWHLSGTSIFREALKQGYVSALGTLFGRTAAFRRLPRLPTRREIGRAADACDDDRLSFEATRFSGVIHVPEEMYHYREVVSNRLTKDRELMAESWICFYKDYREDYKSASLMWFYGRNLHRVLDPHSLGFANIRTAFSAACAEETSWLSKAEALLGFWLSFFVTRTKRSVRHAWHAVFRAGFAIARRLGWEGWPADSKRSRT